MSEPKAVARELDEIVPGLFHYQVHDERIKMESDAFVLKEKEGAVLIDPLPLDKTALARLGRISAILLGTPSHQRSAWRFRRELKAEVYAPAGASGLEEKPDVGYKDGDRLPGGLRAVHAPGPTTDHYAFYLDREPGVLLCSDLLIHEGGKGVQFLPETYQEDPARGRQSARRLLLLKFDVLGFGHGEPIKNGGRAAIEKLVGETPKH